MTLPIRESGKWTTVPSDRRIFGSFVEAGFGRQVDGMWSEMIRNRAFRDRATLGPHTWDWVGLDQEHYNSSMPFWHSGYEEYDWEPFGQLKIERYLGSRTFKGHSSLTVENLSEQPGGLKQEGIRLEAGRAYEFRLLASLLGSIEEAGLNGFDTPGFTPTRKPITVQIGDQETTFELNAVTKAHTWQFTAEKTDCVAVSLILHGAYSVSLSCVSLMPQDNLFGWRRDVVERMRQVAPSVIRFPGGCYASFYNWRDAIGDRDTREPSISHFWGGLEENDVGLDEFMALAGLVGFEPQICINMMTSYPFDARQLVEYLNAPENTGMGRLRMLNGHPAPYGVRLIEMDNEPNRKWTAEQYAHQCIAFAEEMRLADPSIECMLAAYGYHLDKLPGILDIVGKHIQYVIYRDGDPAFVARALEVIRRYNAQHGTVIRLANTEWLPSCHSPELFEDPDVPMDFVWNGKITNDWHTIFSTQQRSWNYALNAAHRLLDYISYGGEFALANFNNLCNTWGQNQIEASKTGAWLSCVGEVFAFFHRHFMPCTAQTLEMEATMFGIMTRSGEKEQLWLVNHGSKEQEAALPGDWMAVEALTGESRLGGCTEAHCVVSSIQPTVREGHVLLPGLSVTVLERERRSTT